ncbi:MAG TPA: hypothetical protein VFW70_01210 [Methylomirabilota bacterium]|nr:hypothetical protein [Methylomirabilota bacterium]
MRRAGLVACLVMLLLPVGCAKSRPVNQLAEVTARNTALLEGQLSDFVRQQQAISAGRIQLVSRLNRATVEALAQRERLAAFEREEGLSEPLALYDELRQSAVQAARVHSERAAALADARQKLVDSQKAVQAPTAALQDTGKSLLAVSHVLSLKEHVKFLFGFFSEVGSDVKKAQEDAKKAKDNGDTKAEKAKDAAADKR